MADANKTDQGTLEAMEGFKSTLEAYQGKIEATVKEMVASKVSSDDPRFTEMKGHLENVETRLTEINNQIKHLGSESVSGIQDELKKKTFSFQKLFAAAYADADAAVTHTDKQKAWDNAGFERELMKAYEDTRLKSNNATDGSAGGYLVPPEASAEVIDLAMAAIPLFNKLPIMKLTGLMGELPIPKVTARPTAYAAGENTAVAESDAAYAEIISRPRRVAAWTKQSKRLLRQSAGVAETLIRRLLGESLALKMHSLAITGTGSSYQPKGLANWSGDFTSNVINLGTNGGRFRMTDAKLMELALATADEMNDNPANYGYLMRPEAEYGMLTERVEQFSGQTNRKGSGFMGGMPFLTKAQLADLVGQYATTTQLSATETRGSSSTTSSVYFGNWKYFFLNMWEDVRFAVSDQASDGSTGSAFLQNQLYMLIEAEMDVVIPRATAFTKVSGAETVITNW